MIFSDGLTYRFTAEGIWRRVWSLKDNGRVVLRICASEKTVELPNEPQLPVDRLILLSIFVWSIVEWTADDGAITALVAATS
jgi:hypothetical protein